MRRWVRGVLSIGSVVLAGPLLVAACGSVQLGQDWRTADRSATGIAPDPGATPEPVVQVYAARAFNWRGIFGVHTWIATKPAGAARYTVHQVLGWRHWSGRPAVASYPDAPDRSWFGQTPRVLADLRGAQAARAIEEIESAVRSYPWVRTYRTWPGPNSNTFTAWVARRVPALGVDLPPTAIGKDYLPGVVARAPSGTGFQVSVLGVLGLTLALEEGIEANILGLSFGLDPLDLGVRLPGVGRLALLS